MTLFDSISGWWSFAFLTAAFVYAYNTRSTRQSADIEAEKDDKQLTELRAGALRRNPDPAKRINAVAWWTAGVIILLLILIGYTTP